MIRAAADAGTTASNVTHDQITVIVLGLLGTTIATLVWVIKNGSRVKETSDYAQIAAHQSSAANKAVNNVGPGDHTLYDMVAAIKEDVLELKAEVKDVRAEQRAFASHGWETLPDDMNTAVALTQTIRGLQNGHSAVHDKLDSIAAELRAHILRQDGTLGPD